jgi:predicted Kef-type K+ transport protein
LHHGGGDTGSEARYRTPSPNRSCCGCSALPRCGCARRDGQHPAAVGTFLVGLSLTGEITDRAREALTPLRDLFAAAFFLAIGLSINPADLPPVLPTAFALAAVTAITKIVTGAFAARRDGVDRQGQLHAGTVLIARGEFSIVVVGLIGTAADPRLGALVAAYVLILAIFGPIVTRLVDAFAGIRKSASPVRTTVGSARLDSGGEGCAAGSSAPRRRPRPGRRQ